MSGAEWHSDCENPVFVSYHWLDENWSMVVFDGVRTPLPSGGLSPHSSAIISARIEPPGKLGEYYLVLTLVREGIAWFEFDAAFKLSTRQIVIKDIIPLTTSDFPSANKQIESIQDAASSWYFFHIPKTAGTSLTKILEDMFPIKEICPAHLWSALLLFSQEELKKFRLFRGHFYSYIDIIVPQRLNCFLFLCAFLGTFTKK